MKQGSANAKHPVEIDSSAEWISFTHEEIKMFAGHEDFSATAKFYNYSTISWDKRIDAFERALG